MDVAGTMTASASADPRTTRFMDTSPLPIPVLPVVIRAELARLQGLPPLRMRAVPLDGRRQRLGESVARRDAETSDLRTIEGVPSIVTGTILHRRDQRVRLAGEAQDLPRQHDVLDLVAAPDVVDLAVD